MGRVLPGLALAAVLLTAGCATVPPATSPSVPTPAASTPSLTVGTPTPTPTPTPLPSPAKLTGRQKYVQSAGHGVKFGVPTAWTMLDLSTFADPDVRQALEPFAKKLGLTVDEYVAQLTQETDLIVTGPEAAGFTPTITVRREEAQTLGEVPTTEKAQADVAAVQGTVTAVTPLTTALGPGYCVTYRHPDGSATRYAATMVLPSAKKTVFLLSLDTTTASDRDAIADGIAATLRAS